MRKPIILTVVMLFAAAGDGFACSAGGGLDLGPIRRIAVGPQLDYIGTPFAGTNINTVRASIGFVFRFGNR